MCAPPHIVHQLIKYWFSGIIEEQFYCFSVSVRLFIVILLFFHSSNLLFFQFVASPFSSSSKSQFSVFFCIKRMNLFQTSLSIWIIINTLTYNVRIIHNGLACHYIRSKQSTKKHEDTKNKYSKETKNLFV